MRSTRNATELVWNIETTDVAVGVPMLDWVGALSICSDAWSDIETWMPPSSPRKISSPLISATTGPAVGLGTYCEVNTGRPASVPPVGVTPGNAGAPTSFVAIDRSIAVVSGMTQKAPDTVRLSPTSSFSIVAMSQRMPCTVPSPVSTVAEVPFSRPAGDSSETAASVLIRVPSIRAVTARASSSRRKVSAATEARISVSFVAAAMAATFSGVSLARV